jgi:uncharacterized membrane protein YgaE (UPF0421/DUF939 family)
MLANIKGQIKKITTCFSQSRRERREKLKTSLSNQRSEPIQYKGQSFFSRNDAKAAKKFKAYLSQRRGERRENRVSHLRIIIEDPKSLLSRADHIKLNSIGDPEYAILHERLIEVDEEADLHVRQF